MRRHLERRHVKIRSQRTPDGGAKEGKGASADYSLSRLMRGTERMEDVTSINYLRSYGPPRNEVHESNQS